MRDNYPFNRHNIWTYGSSDNDSSDDSSVEIGFSSLVSIIWLNTGLCIGILILHNWLKRKLPKIYLGRSNHVSDERKTRPLPLSWNPLNFVSYVLKVPWRDCRAYCGLDQYAYLRFIYMCANITLVSALWAAIILFPVYASGEQEEDVDGWYVLSMANVPKSSGRLWAPVLFMWLFTAYTIFVVGREYRHNMELRMEFLGRGENDIPKQHHYSLMVEKIPPKLRCNRALYDYFNALFPGKVHSVNVCLKVPDLESKVKRRNENCKRLEKAQAFYAVTGRRPTHVVGNGRCRCCGIECAPYTVKDSISAHGEDDEYFDIAGDEENLTCDQSIEYPKGERADSINYYTQMLDKYNREVEVLRHEKQEIANAGNDDTNAAQDWFDNVLRSDLFQYRETNLSERNCSHDDGRASLATSVIDEMVDKKGDDVTLSSSDATEEPLLENFLLSKVVDHARPGVELEGVSTSVKLFRMIGGTFLISMLKRFRRNVNVVVDGVTGSGHSSTGFVTFTDLSAVTAAVNASLTTEPRTLLVAVAPEPRDIHWKNSVTDLDTVDAKKRSGDTIIAVGAVLWSIPVAAIQVWFTADSLSELKGFSWMSASNNEYVANFVNAWLPVVTLLLLMLVLPYVFEWFAKKYEGRKSYSDIDDSITRRYFIYQLANVYVTVTSYSIFDSLNDIIDDPEDTTKLLGETLPTVVGYFVALVATKTLVGAPASLLRLGALSRYGLLRSIFCSKKYLTQREIDVVEKRQRLRFGREYPSVLMVIIICQCYATIAPAILPFGAAFFCVYFVIYKYMCLYTFASKYESGGTLFAVASNRLLVGLIFGQITLIGYLGLREGYAQATATTPLLFIVYNNINYFHKEYQLPSMYLTMERAQEIDKFQTAEAVREFDADAYRQPVLSDDVEGPQQYRREPID